MAIIALSRKKKRNLKYDRKNNRFGWASERDAIHEYGVTLTKLEDVRDADCVIVAVAHDEFKVMKLDDIKKLFKNSDDSEKVLIDVKGLYKINDLKASGMKWWRL